MSPWIQVYANLPSHRKTCKMRDALGLKNNYEAVGLLVCLWAWMAVNAPSGSLAGFSARDIAEAAGYKKSPEKLRTALVDAGFLDELDGGALVAHDWDEHAGLLQDILEEQKRKTRDRVRKHREKKKAVAERPDKPSLDRRDCNVTETLCNAPTKPNLTKPNLYIPVDVVEKPTGTSVTATATAADTDRLEFVGGMLGQGVVLLTEAQEADLLERIGLDGYNCYVKKLSDFILRTGASPKNHYETILRWYAEDTAVRGAQ